MVLILPWLGLVDFGLKTSKVELCRSHWQTSPRSKGQTFQFFSLKIVSSFEKRDNMLTLEVAELKFFACCEHVQDFLPADAFTQKQVKLEYKEA